MPKEQFHYSESATLLHTLDEAAHRGGVSRGQAFDDFLHMTVCALSGGQMEDQYLAVVKKHAEGANGRRSCDSLARLLSELVVAMEQTRHDILGDLFQGAITYGEAGQYLTPESICKLMAQISANGDEVEHKPHRTVCDACCGSGRMLLAVADIHPHWEFVGQDVDVRCVRMTAINLALRNLYGYAVWGNSLAMEQKLIYRTGFNLRGFIREVSIEECPAPVRQVAAESPPSRSNEPGTDKAINPSEDHQLRLF